MTMGDGCRDGGTARCGWTAGWRTAARPRAGGLDRKIPTRTLCRACLPPGACPGGRSVRLDGGVADCVYRPTPAVPCRSEPHGLEVRGGRGWWPGGWVGGKCVMRRDRARRSCQSLWAERSVRGAYPHPPRYACRPLPRRAGEGKKEVGYSSAGVDWAGGRVYRPAGAACKAAGLTWHGARHFCSAWTRTMMQRRLPAPRRSRGGSGRPPRCVPICAGARIRHGRASGPKPIRATRGSRRIPRRPPDQERKSCPTR